MIGTWRQPPPNKVAPNHYKKAYSVKFIFGIGSYYRIRYRLPDNAGEFEAGSEAAFHTQRPPGASFTFTVQADPHVGDFNFNGDLYHATLQNALNDAPDFHIDLGDTFMTEKYYSSREGAWRAVNDHRFYFDHIARFAPLFLVNGNHEGELGWLRDGTANNLAVWSIQARRAYYPCPAPGAFYSGATAPEDPIGIRDSYYAWEWGGALFIVLDPFWHTTTKPTESGDNWDWTLGRAQYDWFKRTLETSKARFKFVFAHHLVGGGPATYEGRGGAEAAGYYEWGGKNLDGSWGFDEKRAGWGVPIHQIMAANGVTIFFHGHDHLFVKQDLDGIVYQECPQPANTSYASTGTAAKYGYVNGDILPNSGHVRVAVSQSQVAVDYIRAYRSEDENAQRINGGVAYSYTIGSGAAAGAGEIEVTDSLGGSRDLKVPFGTLAPGGSASATIKAANLSTTSSLVVGDVAFINGSGDFTLIELPVFPVTLAPRESFSFGVAFAPSAAGAQEYTIKIVSDDADEPMVKVKVSGLCADPLGNIVLGRPTDHSVTISALIDKSLDIYYEYGLAPGVYSAQTASAAITSGTPLETIINEVQPNQRYYYRMRYRTAGAADFSAGMEHTFHTQRSQGSAFTFTIQTDSHLYDKKCNTTLYSIALRNQLADAPDFVIDMGDTFGDDHDLSITRNQMFQLHLNQRPYFGQVCHSAPLFFVLGNHEAEGGYYLDGTANNLAMYGTLARQYYYPNPVPDGFYTGNTVSEPFAGLPGNYYAWEWGDALFVVLDAYRHETTDPKVSGDLWDWTLGMAQYDWFKQTLENSRSRFKFVFAHHVLGQTRGGAAWADKFEWGGHGNNGALDFAAKRPGWPAPIHQLMAANGVTIFFQGHDHLFAKEEVDGVVYQEVPMPSDATYNVGAENADAYLGDVMTNSGHLRVTVAPSRVTVDYVRAWLPEDESGGKVNGELAYTYKIIEYPGASGWFLY